MAAVSAAVLQWCVPVRQVAPHCEHLRSFMLLQTSMKDHLSTTGRYITKTTQHRHTHAAFQRPTPWPKPVLRLPKELRKFQDT